MVLYLKNEDLAAFRQRNADAQTDGELEGHIGGLLGENALDIWRFPG